MDNNNLLIGALCVTVILIIALVVMYLTRRNPETNVATLDPKAEHKFGTVQNLEHVVKTLGNSELTIFEIRGLDGSIFYAAYPGHSRDVKNGDKLEYVPGTEEIGNLRMISTSQDAGGFITKTQNVRKYYNLEKFKVIGNTYEDQSL